MGTKIDDLPQVATPTGSDELPISQDNGSGGRITYKATLDQVKNYVKNTGGGTGSVTSVGVTSPDGSIGVFGSPIVGAGTITVNISSVKLDKINDGGATSGQVLTYNGSTSTWVASAAPGTVTNNVDNTPIGTISWFAISAAPTGYLECNGNAISQSTYSDLFAVIGNTFNTGGEAAGTFRLPDLRGEFVRGWDHTKGVDSGRAFGSRQNDSVIEHYHQQLLEDQLGSPGGNVSPDAKGGIIENGLTSGVRNSSNQSIGGTETRPRNIALLPCIKALKTVTGSVAALNFIEKPASVSDGQVLTYNGSTSTWVASSLSSNGFNASLSSNGYQKLPSGLIMQWGVYDTTATGTATITFPISFPTECVNVVGTQKATSVVTSDIIGIGTITNSNVVFWFSTNADGAGVARLYWQAIGY